MEIFNQQRMDRCMEIARLIVDSFQQTNTIDYIVRTNKDLNGMSVLDLRGEYFTIEVGQELYEVPFTDLLVIVSIIEERGKAMRAHLDGNKPSGDLTFEITEDWPDEEAACLFSRILIRAPGHEGGRFHPFTAISITDTGEA